MQVKLTDIFLRSIRALKIAATEATVVTKALERKHVQVGNIFGFLHCGSSLFWPCNARLLDLALLDLQKRGRGNSESFENFNQRGTGKFQHRSKTQDWQHHYFTFKIRRTRYSDAKKCCTLMSDLKTNYESQFDMQRYFQYRVYYFDQKLHEKVYFLRRM